MNIDNEILKYCLNNEGSFYYEGSDTENGDTEMYFIYFDDINLDSENAIKVTEDEDEIKIFTTSEHSFNNGLGFITNICSARDQECAIMLCESLNKLKSIYTKSKS